MSSWVTLGHQRSQLTFYWYLTMSCRTAWLHPPVTECKFLCLMYNEAKQTKMSEFGAEKGLLPGQARRMVARAQKTLKPLMVCFSGEIFIGKIWGEGCRVCDFLLIGWWWGNKAVLQESCPQSEITILHRGNLLQKNSKILLCIFLERNQDPAPRLHDGFLTVPPFFLNSLSSLTSSCLNLPLELREGQGGWMKPISYKQETGDTERICTREGPTGSCSISFLDEHLQL